MGDNFQVTFPPPSFRPAIAFTRGRLCSRVSPPVWSRCAPAVMNLAPENAEQKIISSALFTRDLPKRHSNQTPADRPRLRRHLRDASGGNLEYVTVLLRSLAFQNSSARQFRRIRASKNSKPATAMISILATRWHCQCLHETFQQSVSQSVM